MGRLRQTLRPKERPGAENLRRAFCCSGQCGDYFLCIIFLLKALMSGT
jgi:hypothetical protein